MSAQLEDAHPDKVATPQKTSHLLTVLVPAVAGILVALITVFPQLRNKDAAIGDLQRQVMQLKSNLLAEPTAKPPAEAPKQLIITGRVLDASGKRPMGWAEIYLVPQNKPKLIGRTEEDGTFRFPDMPDQQYRIVVRNSETGKITVGDLDADIRETKLDGALVKYDVKK